MTVTCQRRGCWKDTICGVSYWTWSFFSEYIFSKSGRGVLVIFEAALKIHCWSFLSSKVQLVDLVRSFCGSPDFLRVRKNSLSWAFFSTSLEFSLHVLLETLHLFHLFSSDLQAGMFCVLVFPEVIDKSLFVFSSKSLAWHQDVRAWKSYIQMKRW